MAARERIADRFRVVDGSGFRLADRDPGDTAGIAKSAAQTSLADDVERLSELQEKLYAQDRWAVLLIFQAMDAAGKDSAIKHVFSGLNPLGCQVYSFKSPSSEELDHDFMWRTSKRLPERGRIGIFNRSYYEEMLIVRVHPEILANQRLPSSLVTKRIWKERFEDVAAFERYLARNGVLILKFFLHLSQEEQRRRFLARIDEPEKNWKFALADVQERHYWNDYQRAYEDVIRNTAAPHAPWHVVPADHKWFTRLVVARTIVTALEKLDLSFPKLDSARRRDLQSARAVLEEEAGPTRSKRRAARP